MADVKWIKITTDIFDDEKILMIESLPDSDAIIICWIKLLCLAGKQNNSGVFLLNDKVPYTDKMLATIFRRKESTVQMALKVFEDFGMIERINGVITIPNWEKHQNIDGLEKIKEQTRERVYKHRQKQKMLASKESNVTSNVTDSVTSNVTVTLCNATEETRQKETRQEETITTSKEVVCPSASQTDVQTVVDAWNNAGLPAIRKCNRASNRGKMLYQRLAEYGVDDVLQAVENASNSNFLKGQNKNGWIITFEWFVKPNNFLKVLEGNYKNRESVSVNTYSQKSWEDIAAEWEAENG